jgi:hypothetical protein
MKKVKVFQRISDFESFINSPKVNILSYDVKAVVKSEVNRDGFLASVFYDEKEFDEELVDPKNSKIRNHEVLEDKQMQGIEYYIREFIQSFVYGECQLCLTEMAHRYNTTTQIISESIWGLHKEGAFQYLQMKWVDLFDGRTLQFAIFKSKDSLMFNHDTEARDTILNQLGNFIQQGMDELEKKNSNWHELTPKLLTYHPAEVNYKVQCLMKLSFSKKAK